MLDNRSPYQIAGRMLTNVLYQPWTGDLAIVRSQDGPIP